MPCMGCRVKPERLRIVLIAIVVMLQPAVAVAFGAKAHRTIGAIAEQSLCAEAREQLAVILEGESLAEAGLWADRIRGDSSWDAARPWHYINIPDGAEIQGGRLPADLKRRSQGDVVWAIAEMNRRLDTIPSDQAEHAQALKFLIHFIG